MRRFLLAAAVLCLLVQAGPARAQAPARGSGRINVALQVVFPPLTAVGVKPLAFGVIPAGTNSATVLPNTPQGGEFRLSGIRNRKSVAISFTLPANLVAPSGRTMPIDFNGNFAASCEIDGGTNVCDASTYQVWNPVTTPVMTDLPERTKPGRPKFTEQQYQVFIGGRVTPGAAPAAGRYAGTITITVVAN
jgi:spore coat protein U-like protein